MRTFLLSAFALLATLAGASTAADPKPAPKAAPGVAHLVFFTVNDNGEAARTKLVDACAKYLSKHKGIRYFSVGVRAADIKGDFNDGGYDVALNIVFDDKASHDAYQDAADHKKFIEENKANWKDVRVFDFGYQGSKPADVTDGKGPMIAHAVFFTLADKSAEGKAKFVEAVNTLKAPGASYHLFGTGQRIASLDRDVNDKEFDVGLFIVFADRKALDAYIPADYHQKFVTDNKAKWKGVRVFDSTLQK